MSLLVEEAKNMCPHQTFTEATEGNVAVLFGLTAFVFVAAAGGAVD
jgi:Flp pilus assembly protein TadG